MIRKKADTGEIPVSAFFAPLFFGKAGQKREGRNQRA